MKLFVTSDIHSFFTPFKAALDEAGFESGNSEHLLVICGDCFDRGNESCDLYKYLKATPNKIIVKGNHEELLEECIKRGMPYMHDYSNGTYKTICDLGGMSHGRDFSECCVITWNIVKPLLDQMVDYYETKKFVFVHSTIPLKEDWRLAHAQEWKDARWSNPFEFWEQVKIENKTVIFGHWHTSWARTRDEICSEWGPDSCFEPYDGGDFIGLDACTAYTKKVNVLVLEDDLLGGKLF